MKKNYKKYIEILGRYVLAGAMVLCWWSIFFPQMVMNQDCYQVLDKEGQPVVEERFLTEEPHWTEMADYWEILQADSEDVVLTSKLWEYFKDMGWFE